MRKFWNFLFWFDSFENISLKRAEVASEGPDFLSQLCSCAIPSREFCSGVTRVDGLCPVFTAITPTWNGSGSQRRDMSPLYVPRKRKPVKSQCKSGVVKAALFLHAFPKAEISVASPAAFKQTPERACELSSGGLFQVRIKSSADCGCPAGKVACPLFMSCRTTRL